MSAPTICGQINPAKGQTFIKKQLWSLWYVWMREDFCIIIFSLSFNATSVMASRDACETKSVSLQISLLATVPCKETPRLFAMEYQASSLLKNGGSGLWHKMASSLPRERPQRPSERNRWRCRSDFGRSDCGLGSFFPPFHPISKPPLHFGSGDQGMTLSVEPSYPHLGIRRSPCTPTQIGPDLGLDYFPPSISA